MSSLIETDKKYVLHGWGYSDIIITEAKGATFKDQNGKEYLDFLSQTAGVLGVGHAHPKIVKAVKDQLDKGLTHTLTMFGNEPRIRLGEKLASIAPGPLKNNCMTYFSCGGTEANETALKLAMKATGKKEVISVFWAYHGGTLAMSSLVGQSWHREKLVRFPGLSQMPNAYCYRCYFGQKYPGCDLECARYLEHHIKHATSNDVAAFILEPCQGNGGHQLPPTPEYFKIIREICDKYGVLYITDEVQTGMGRTGKIWGADYFNAKPDIMTTGKALGGGLPVSGTSIRSDLVPEDLKTAQWHIFTMGGGPILAAAGAAAIDVLLEEKLWEKAASTGQYMTKRLKEIEGKHRLIGEVRGPGLFIGIELVKDKKTKAPATDEAVQVFSNCLGNGVLFGLNAKAGVGNIIKMKPPLAITKQEADKALDIFENALKTVEK
jgi:4-aminobutyrate aminotransferase-like enzyme